MTRSIADAFPPMQIDVLCQNIKNFPSMSFQEQSSFVTELVRIHPIVNIVWDGAELLRVRALAPEDEISAVKDVVWPETKVVKPGRLDVDGHPVVYLATSRETALRETRVEDNLVALARFRALPETPIITCPIGEMVLLLRTGSGRMLTEDNAKTLVGMLNACPLEQARAIAIADTFLYEVLTTPGDDYRLTSLVSQAIFQKNTRVDAILYPSQVQTAGVNVAVRRDRFWKKWGLASVTQARAEHLAAGFFRLSKIKQVDGVYTNGKFKWAEDYSADESHLLLDPLWQPSEFFNPD
jgi:RES domain-containing protein